MTALMISRGMYEFAKGRHLAKTIDTRAEHANVEPSPKDPNWSTNRGKPTMLEQTEGSCSYETFEPKAPICLVVGNEIEGVSKDILSYCDAAIEIEMAGIKNSLNVAVAFGIIAYYFRGCFRDSLQKGKGS